ncbi:DNA repair photolyase [Sphaerotilus mobilis]|uniref:DNA repair photolyase n=1 Tax=Sphaerotilus mobilis TaxID=47994 RepID=A0A4Q7LRQ2_9BURK|nr:DNA repair photolyase [Sphaerotilus mobilis]
MRGRGTGWRIAHRFEREQRADTDDGWPGEDEATAADEAGAGSPPPRGPRTVVRIEQAGRILSRNDSPDVPFESAVNPYRGCEHGCIYCYARPTHSYLNLSPGLDFETQLVAKANAAERLRAELARPGYRPSPINIGSATDAYQPIERTHRLTRALLEVLDETCHPATVVTKSGGIVRDLNLLARMAARQQLIVFVSVTSLDARLSARLEPRAAAPARRLATIRALADAGVWVGVNVAPIIPFVNEPEIEHILEAAAEAGARSAHWTVVRLPWEVAPLFRDWLQIHVPDRADRVMARIREMRGGQDYNADFASRMKGQGTWATLLRQRVEKGAARVGLVRQTPVLDVSAFVPPSRPGPARPVDLQHDLF